MKTVLVADIFGKTPALEALQLSLKADAIIDPYLGVLMGFKNETQAYQYFSNNIGLDRYLALLREGVKAINDQVLLIGFSVGATVTWRFSASGASKKLRCICYYGSAIRQYTNLDPKCSTKLIFPFKEEHFDVNVLHDKLVLKDNVSSQIVKYRHGFMNSYSNNFNKEGYKEHLQILISEINTHS